MHKELFEELDTPGKWDRRMAGERFMSYLYEMFVNVV